MAHLYAVQVISGNMFFLVRLCILQEVPQSRHGIETATLARTMNGNMSLDLALLFIGMKRG